MLNFERSQSNLEHYACPGCLPTVNCKRIKFSEPIKFERINGSYETTAEGLRPIHIYDLLGVIYCVTFSIPTIMTNG